MVYGLGRKATFPVKVTGSPTAFEATRSGGVFSTSASSFGVDFSGASGADALLVLAGPVQGSGGKGGAGARGGKGGKGESVQTVEAGKNTFTVMTLGIAASEPKADGDNLVVGGQTVSYAGQKLSFIKGGAPAKEAR